MRPLRAPPPVRNPQPATRSPQPVYQEPLNPQPATGWDALGGSLGSLGSATRTPARVPSVRVGEASDTAHPHACPRYEWGKRATPPRPPSNLCWGRTLVQGPAAAPGACTSLLLLHVITRRIQHRNHQPHLVLHLQGIGVNPLEIALPWISSACVSVGSGKHPPSGVPRFLISFASPRRVVHPTPCRPSVRVSRAARQTTITAHHPPTRV